MVADKEKVLCRCMNVTLEDLKNVINNGAKTFGEVQAITNVSTGCSKCKDTVNVMINELLERQ